MDTVPTHQQGMCEKGYTDGQDSFLAFRLASVCIKLLRSCSCRPRPGSVKEKDSCHAPRVLPDKKAIIPSERNRWSEDRHVPDAAWVHLLLYLASLTQ